MPRRRAKFSAVIPEACRALYIRAPIFVIKSSPEVIFAKKEVNHKTRNAFQKKDTFEVSSGETRTLFLKNRPLSFTLKSSTSIIEHTNCIICRYFCQYSLVIPSCPKKLLPPPSDLPQISRTPPIFFFQSRFARKRKSSK